MLGLGAAAALRPRCRPGYCRDRARELAAYAEAAAAGGARRSGSSTEVRSFAPSSQPSMAGRDTKEIKLALRGRGINTSSPQREDAVIDMDEKKASSALRISPHYYNTKEEIDTAVEALEEMLST